MPWNPFDALDARQREQLESYAEQLRSFNRSINLISREDEDAVEEHHLLHCLAFTRRAFPEGAVLVDWGTGGGLPAIPVAIACPHVTVHAVDAVDKKIRAVRTMARRLGLENLHAWHARAESWSGPVDYSISRATAPLELLWRWHVGARREPPLTVPADCWPPGLFCLKGGDLEEEGTELHAAFPSTRVEREPLLPLFERPFFAEKCLLTVVETEP